VHPDTAWLCAGCDAELLHVIAEHTRSLAGYGPFVMQVRVVVPAVCSYPVAHCKTHEVPYASIAVHPDAICECEGIAPALHAIARHWEPVVQFPVASHVTVVEPGA
jgi:hypothetical protein